mgnify:CR=1 FL=1
MNQDLKHFRKYCRTLRREAQGESGIALIFAIGFLAVLMVIGLGFAANSLIAGKIAKNSNFKTQATVLADSALTQASLTLQESYNAPSTYGYDLHHIYSQDESKRFVNYRTNTGDEDTVSYDNGTYPWGKDDDSDDASEANRDYQTFLDTFQINIANQAVYKLEDMEDYQKFVPEAVRRNTGRQSRFAWHYIPVDNSSIVRDADDEDEYADEEEQFTQIIGRIAYIALPPVNKLDITSTSMDAAEKMADRVKGYNSVEDDEEKVKNFAQQFDLSTFKEDYLFGSSTDLNNVQLPPKRDPESSADPLSCYMANRWVSFEQFYASMYDGYKPSAFDDHKNTTWSYLDFVGNPRPEVFWYDKGADRKIDESEMYPRFDLSADLLCKAPNHTHSDDCVARLLDSSNIEAVDLDDDDHTFDAAKTIQYFRIIGATPRSFKSLKALRSQIVANFLDYQDDDDIPTSGVISGDEDAGDIQSCPPENWIAKTADNDGNMPDFTGNERSWYLSALDSTVYCDVDITRSSIDNSLTATLAVNAAVFPHLYYMFEYQDQNYSDFGETQPDGDLKKAANCEVQVTGKFTIYYQLGLQSGTKEVPFSQTVTMSTSSSGSTSASGNTEFSLDLGISSVTMPAGTPFPISVRLLDVDLYDMILKQDNIPVDCAKLRVTLSQQNSTDRSDHYPSFREAYNVSINNSEFRGAQLAPSVPMLPDDDSGSVSDGTDISTWTEGTHAGNQIVFRTICSDPRQNLNPGDWQPLEWKNWNNPENYLPSDTTGDRESEVTAWITNRPMKTAAELGRIHRGAQWETINLRACGSSPADYNPNADLNAEGISYKMGDAGILDQVTEIFGSGYRFGTWDPNLTEPVIYDDDELYYSSPLLQSLLKGIFKDDDCLSLAQSLTYGIASDTSLSSDLELRPFNRVKQFRKRPDKDVTGTTVSFTQDDETGSDSVFRSASNPTIGSGKKFLLNRAMLADQAVYWPGRTDMITTFSNMVRQVAGKNYTEGNKMQQEALLSKFIMTAETGYFPTTVQVLIVAQSIEDIGALTDDNTYADEEPVGLPVTLVSSKGNAITKDCVMGQFDYYYDEDNDEEVYFDEITGEVKMLVTFTRDIWSNKWKIFDIQYLQ